MDLKDSYKSSLHYLALQPGHSGLSFEEFLLYFSNKDIGMLNISISETFLRDAFHQRLGSFYTYNKISCAGEFEMIANTYLMLEKVVAPTVEMSKLSLFIT